MKTDMIEENPVEINQIGKTIEIPLRKSVVDTYKLK